MSAMPSMATESVRRNEPTRCAMCQQRSLPPFAERPLRNIGRARADHSGLMPANLTTLPHFSVSSAMSLPKSAGEPGSTVPPRSASRALILGSARAGVDLLVELVDDLGGRVLGRADADSSARLVARHEFADGRDVRQRRPSASRVVTASARSLPALMCSIDAAWCRRRPAPARRAGRSARAPRRDKAHAPCRRRSSS